MNDLKSKAMRMIRMVVVVATIAVGVKGHTSLGEYAMCALLFICVAAGAVMPATSMQAVTQISHASENDKRSYESMILMMISWRGKVLKFVGSVKSTESPRGLFT